MGLLEPHGGGGGLLRRAALSRGGPVVIVHSLAHAAAALRAASAQGCTLTLLSAPAAGLSGGPGWWSGLIAAARQVAPAAQSMAVLDCADDAGAAQAALRAGIEAIVFTGRADLAARLADIAGQRGCRLLTARPGPALDLATEFFASPDRLARCCAEHLRG